jgi:glyceraldehyde-3-phosphate dehydrogenase/erythrose-4-phosphate dehydrogenase
MTVRVGINGFGRIGRDFLRCVLARGTDLIEVVAVNDITDTATLANLLKYDSTYGPLLEQVGHTGDTITVGDQVLRMMAERDPAAMDWRGVGVDIVIESTGRFRTREAAAAHLTAGAAKVLLSSPGKGVDATIVLGVNEDTYDPAGHHFISNASCTTNCVAPMVSVRHRAFGIRHGLVTTIHRSSGPSRSTWCSPTPPQAIRRGLLRYNEDLIVSHDIIGDPSSCIFDGPLTQANGNIVKVFGWYDNEWGYTSRLLDLTELVARAI